MQQKPSSAASNCISSDCGLSMCSPGMFPGAQSTDFPRRLRLGLRSELAVARTEAPALASSIASTPGSARSAELPRRW
eukprot:CAMPEP_0175378904 /NCGR_PEP_ID=MMETSP0095-20121207/25536_1 /TAXON_ID=311494 /ORGANISM="Alexandrium monilatum, Strain CCMP3105" /LENGTH=77 /DNA_ID=CAMNT_0016677243 /DNA_START=408 /DNA_END=638 /DNA_ORIENTATION=-